MNTLTHPGDSRLRTRISRTARVGTPEIQIAFAVNICVRTLQLFYPTELQHPAIQLNLQVLETLARFATSGKHPAATIFWAKTRCSFVPPGNANQSGPHNGAYKPSPEFPPAPKFIVTGPNGQRHVTGPDGVRRTVGPDGEPWEEDYP